MKRAVVTGGSHGIGRGCAIALARHGYDVAFSYLTCEEDAEAVRRAVEGMGRRCFVHRADLSDPNAPVPLIKECAEELGGIDVMVCNAGRTKHYSVLNVTNEEMSYLMDLNFRSYILCAGEAARQMIRRGTKGSIVFITSSRGDRAYPEDMLYGALKAGVRRACESIALDLSPYGIRANCIAPGWTLTDTVDEPHPGKLDGIVPLGRGGLPIDVGEAVAYLSGESAGYITGVTLRMDGGLVLPGIPERLAGTAAWIDPEWTKEQYRLMKEREED